MAWVGLKMGRRGVRWMSRLRLLILWLHWRCFGFGFTHMGVKTSWTHKSYGICILSRNLFR
jgi:hypothetical protein